MNDADAVEAAVAAWEKRLEREPDIDIDFWTLLTEARIISAPWTGSRVSTGQRAAGLPKSPRGDAPETGKAQIPFHSMAIDSTRRPK